MAKQRICGVLELPSSNGGRAYSKICILLGEEKSARDPLYGTGLSDGLEFLGDLVILLVVLRELDEGKRRTVEITDDEILGGAICGDGL